VAQDKPSARQIDVQHRHICVPRKCHRHLHARRRPLKPSRMWESNESHFSSMHEAWSAKGAQEFVPGAIAGNLNPGYDYPGYQYQGYQYHSSPIYPGMGAGPLHSQWPPSTPMSHRFHPGLQITGYPPVVPNPPRQYPSHFFVVLWNLSASYSSQDIKNELIEFDLAPQGVQMHPEVPGSCIVSFRELWEANALTVILDVTEDILKVANGKPIRARAVKSGEDLSKALNEDMPPELSKTLLRQENGDQSRTPMQSKQ